MKFVPNGLSRASYRTLLKLNASSPTIMVVAGVVGFGATVVLAAKATRNIEPVIEGHQKARMQVAETVYVSKRAQQQDLARVYAGSAAEFTKLYGPTIVVGGLSVASVLYGHKVLRGRHIASVAAYTGLLEQFQAYRSRVARTLGPEVERGIFDGAHGEWEDDPDNKGNQILMPKFDELEAASSYLRPWFDQTNPNWTPDPVSNYLFLKGTQAHLNNMLQIRGHVFVNDVFDALRFPRTNEGQVAGWVFNSHDGDNFIDLGFMDGIDPQTVAFREGASKIVQLNLNIDGNIYGLI